MPDPQRWAGYHSNKVPTVCMLLLVEQVFAAESVSGVSNSERCPILLQTKVNEAALTDPVDTRACVEDFGCDAPNPTNPSALLLTLRRPTRIVTYVPVCIFTLASRARPLPFGGTA